MSFLKSEDRCVLCLEQKRQPVSVQCGHSFCTECLTVYRSYRKHSWANRCPICRAILKDKTSMSKKNSANSNRNYVNFLSSSSVNMENAITTDPISYGEQRGILEELIFIASEHQDLQEIGIIDDDNVDDVDNNDAVDENDQNNVDDDDEQDEDDDYDDDDDDEDDEFDNAANLDVFTDYSDADSYFMDDDAYESDLEPHFMDESDLEPHFMDDDESDEYDADDEYLYVDSEIAAAELSIIDCEQYDDNILENSNPDPLTYSILSDDSDVVLVDDVVIAVD